MYFGEIPEYFKKNYLNIINFNYEKYNIFEYLYAGLFATKLYLKKDIFYSNINKIITELEDKKFDKINKFIFDELFLYNIFKEFICCEHSDENKINKLKKLFINLDSAKFNIIYILQDKYENYKLYYDNNVKYYDNAIIIELSYEEIITGLNNNLFNNNDIKNNMYMTHYNNKIVDKNYDYIFEIYNEILLQLYFNKYILNYNSYISNIIIFDKKKLINIQTYSNKLCNLCMDNMYDIPFFIIKNFYENELNKLKNGGNINYYNKYIKYKSKYLNLKNIY
jgi:hypothetical protein